MVAKYWCTNQEFCFRLLMKLFLEAPIITDEATDLLKDFSGREPSAINILQELVIRRPPRHLYYINAILTHTGHENSEVISLYFFLTLSFNYLDYASLPCSH